MPCVNRSHLTFFKVLAVTLASMLDSGYVQAAQLFPPQNSSSTSCPPYEFLAWVNGGVSCVDPSAAISCPAGQVLNGISKGEPVCVDPQTPLPTCAGGEYLTSSNGGFVCSAPTGTKPKLVYTEGRSCNAGAGWPGGVQGGCVFAGNNGGTNTYNLTSSAAHQLCVLSSTAGYSGGLWGQCTVSGSPGSQWNLYTAVYRNQVNCSMNCYDFQ